MDLLILAMEMPRELLGILLLLLLGFYKYGRLHELWGFDIWGASWVVKVPYVITGFLILILWYNILTSGFNPASFISVILITVVFLLVLSTRKPIKKMDPTLVRKLFNIISPIVIVALFYQGLTSGRTWLIVWAIILTILFLVGILKPKGEERI
jgi:hypothetical protein